MTKILLSGMVLATILLALGMSAQGFAMPMPDKTQDVVGSYVLAKDTTQQQMMLVCDPPTTKGGKATFHLVPRPIEGVDGIPIQTSTNSPELILANVATPNGGIVLKLIPKPQEGIDGIPIQTPKATNTSTQPQVSAQPELILANVATPNGGTVLKVIPKPQEGIDGIPISKAADSPTILVAEPITSKGATPVFHMVPKPAPNPWDYSS